MSADLVIDAAAGTDLEIGAALEALRQNRVGRIKRADAEIPVKYAEIKEIERQIELYRVDRAWCGESLKTLDRRIAAMEE